MTTNTNRQRWINDTYNSSSNDLGKNWDQTELFATSRQANTAKKQNGHTITQSFSDSMKMNETLSKIGGASGMLELLQRQRPTSTTQPDTPAKKSGSDKE